MVPALLLPSRKPIAPASAGDRAILPAAPKAVKWKSEIHPKLSNPKQAPGADRAISCED